jgi:hypothetical protein
MIIYPGVPVHQVVAVFTTVLSRVIPSHLSRRTFRGKDGRRCRRFLKRTFVDDFKLVELVDSETAVELGLELGLALGSSL